MFNSKEGVNPYDDGIYQYTQIDGKPFCLIIPSGWKPGSGKVIWHYHGYRLAEWDREREGHYIGEGTIEYRGFHFLKSLMKKAPDTVMVCPIGTVGAGYNYYSLRRDYGTVHHIIPALNAVARRLNAPDFTDVILSGHSGAYLPLSPVLDGGTGTLPVKTVFLFDCLYNGTNMQAFKSFLTSNKDHRIFVASPEGSPTHPNSKALASLSNCVLKEPVGLSHWDLVGVYFEEFLGLERGQR